jgi:hypothetical protein
MIGKIKALGLALVAIAALSAVAASAAQAGSLDPAATPSVITGQATTAPVFTVQKTVSGSKFNALCPAGTLEGTVQGQTDVTEGTLTATYSGLEESCEFAGLGAEVKMNGCKYTFTGAPIGALVAEIDIVGCTAGKKIEIKTAICNLTIGEQNNRGTLTLSNALGATPKHLTVFPAVVGLTVTQDGAGCPDGNNHIGTNGRFQGYVTVKAFKDSGTKQVTIHGHQYNEHLCGQQVDLVAT